MSPLWCLVLLPWCLASGLVQEGHNHLVQEGQNHLVQQGHNHLVNNCTNEVARECLLAMEGQIH